MSSVGEVTVDNRTRTVTVTIRVSDLSNITDIYETDTVNFPVTALLFESNLEVGITNRYTVSNGSESVNGTFTGMVVSEAGISIPRGSQFVTIAIPYENSTVKQKLVVDWSNEETVEHGTVEYDLVVNYIS